MPAYNAEKTIVRAVSSILNQNFFDIELIVIDDGSLDKTSQLLSQFSDERLRIIKQDNSGIVTALNYGISLAKSSFIARADADDWYEPTRISSQFDQLAGNSSIVLSFTKFMLVYPDGSTSKPPNDPAGENFRDKIFLRNFVMHSSVIFRLDSFYAVGGYRQEWSGIEDWDLWIRLSNSGKVACVDQFLSFLNVHDSSYSALNEFHQVKLGIKLRMDLLRNRVYPVHYIRFIFRSLFKLSLGARGMRLIRRVRGVRRYET